MNSSQGGAETHFQEMETSMISFNVKIRPLDSSEHGMYREEENQWPVLPRIGELIQYADGETLARVVDVEHYLIDEMPHIIVVFEVDTEEYKAITSQEGWGDLIWG